MTAAALVVVASISAMAAPASADPGDPDPGEGTDRAIVTPDVDRQLARAGSAPLLGGAAARATIEDFRRNPILSEGRAADICHGRLRRGTAWAYGTITSRFGGSPGTLYSCRERYAVHEDPDCDGTAVDPARSPNFTSDCWSNHAQGRAFDVMVGRSSAGYNQWRGNAIVDWLLAPDAVGNQNAMARRLGVQQILWNDRCWNSDGDRGVDRARKMRVCGYAHFDHVHIDLTLDGARGRVSYWGTTPRSPSPKLSGMFVRIPRRGSWSSRAWTNLRTGRVTAGEWATSWERTIAGDWDGDGARDDMFIWSTDDGHWMIRSWNGRRRPIVARGQWRTGFDDVIAADLDRDGKLDDMLVWDRHTGAWEVQAWAGFSPTLRQTGPWDPTYDRVIAGDWDSDGWIDETFLWDVDSGRWSVHSWSGFVPSLRRQSAWSTAWEEIIAGDWDAQGHFDEMFLWDRETGRWVVLTWSDVNATERAAGAWSTRWDRFFAADLDTDGRIDDLYARDDTSGDWMIRSWHRFVPQRQEVGSGRSTWRQFTFGVWG